MFEVLWSHYQSNSVFFISAINFVCLLISRRNKYTSFLQQQGCEEWYEYANWTDYVYQGLFGMKKRQMVEAWELVEGSRAIGRNYIPEAEGLEAVAYCETQVIELFHQDLRQAHDDAVSFAKKKFKLDF
jgi:hypothetical protein